MHNKTTIPLLLISMLILGACGRQPASEALKNDDLVGIYRLDVKRLYKQIQPEGLQELALTLKADGSFVTTNVFADCFFSYTPTPATSEAKGTWKLRHVSEGASLFYTGENDYLDLDFATTPGPGLFSTPLGSGPSISMNFHSGRQDACVFYLVKQKQSP